MAPGRDGGASGVSWYSRKSKSSPGRRPAAILPVRPGVPAAAAAPSGSAPEERKKKTKGKAIRKKLQPLLSEEPHKLLKRSDTECRGGEIRKSVWVCGEGEDGRRGDAGGDGGANAEGRGGAVSGAGLPLGGARRRGSRGSPRGCRQRAGTSGRRPGAARQAVGAGLNAAGAAVRGMRAAKPGRRPSSADGGRVM